MARNLILSIGSIGFTSFPCIKTRICPPGLPVYDLICLGDVQDEMVSGTPIHLVLDLYCVVTLILSVMRPTMMVSSANLTTMFHGGIIEQNGLEYIIIKFILEAKLFFLPILFNCKHVRNDSLF